MNWNTTNIPNLKGKTIIITGGNKGLGYQMSLELANKNAHIIIACRTISKGEEAALNIKNKLLKDVSITVIPLDLNDINSIKSFAQIFKDKYQKLDILINNAGVVNLKEKIETKTGLEMHMSTNHFGHFALTGLLFPILISTPNARVVTMSSGGYRSGNIDFDDLNWAKREYKREKAYGDSKLANLLFMQELQNKFKLYNSDALSVAAHPGLSATERQQTIGIGGWLSKIIAQSVYMGALPALRAATDTDTKPKTYYGPKYFIRGYPKIEKLKQNALNPKASIKLWSVSEKITGIKYTL